MSAKADPGNQGVWIQEDVQGSKMSAKADHLLRKETTDIGVQGSKMSANADEMPRGKKQLSDIFA